MADSHIIQEHQGFGALGEDIVHAHCHGIYADGVVLVKGESNLELGSDSVSAADQYRVFDSKGAKVEHASERTNAAHHTLAGRGSDVLLDAADYLVACFKVYSCVFVRFCHIELFVFS